MAVIIVIASTGWILYGLSLPIYTFHAVRQAHTAMVAFSLWTEGISLEHSRLFFGGLSGTVIPFELPVYDAAVALGYHLLGQHDAVAKGVAVLFSAGACAMFVALGRMLLPGVASICWLAAFLLAPTWVHHAQTVQPEAIMMFIAVGMVLCTIKTYRTGSHGYAVLLCVLSALGVCIKAHEIFHLFLLPWALLVFGTRKRGFVAVAAIQLLISAVAAYLWTRVGIRWPDTSLSEIVWQFFDVSRFFDIQSIGKAGVTIVLLLASPVVAYFVWLGARSLQAKTRTSEWSALGLCGLAYLIAGYPLYSYHTFYLNPLVPFVALFSIKGLVAFPEISMSTRRRQWAVAGLLVVSVPLWFLGTQLLYTMQTAQIAPAGVLAQKYSDPEEPVIVLDQSARWSRSSVETRALYASKRLGWNITSNNLSQARGELRSHRAQGAKLVLVLDYDPQFEPRVMTLFRSYRPEYTVYDPEALGLVLLEKDDTYDVSVWRFDDSD